MGRKHTEEEKRKIGASVSRGRLKLKKKRGYLNPPEIRMKMTEGMRKVWKDPKRRAEIIKKNPILSGKAIGSKNPNWKGGRDWKKIKREALIRDDYTCQRCGLREILIMEVDHIKPKAIYPELEFEPSNTITLCPNCHRRKTIEDRKIIKIFKGREIIKSNKRIK